MEPATGSRSQTAGASPLWQHNGIMTLETLLLLQHILLGQQLVVSDPTFTETARKVLNALSELDEAIQAASVASAASAPREPSESAAQST
jgi:hypothetical protein